MDISLLILTHSDFNDLWIPFFDRLKKYLNISFASCYLCTDINSSKEILNKLYHFDEIYYYEDNWSYPKRMEVALKNIKENYVLVFHDNNILVDFTDIESFQYIEQWIYQNQPDQLRLHAGASETPGNHIYKDIYQMLPTDIYKYSVYPTIWKKVSLQNIFNTFPNKHYRDIENDETQQYILTMKNYYIWNLEKSPPRGCGSEVTPHVIKYLHVILRGQWTLRWDKNEILKISQEYNIDLTKRGFYQLPCWNHNLPKSYYIYKQNHKCII